jgi:hypothetical protein
MKQNALLMLVFLMFGSGLSASRAQSTAENPAESARQAVHEFIGAWNRADNAQLRKAMHFPFVSMFEGNVIVAEGPEDFSTDFDSLRQDQGWARTTIDALRVLRETPTSAFIEMDYSRVDDSGEVYLSATIMYIATKLDEEWHLQFRMPIRD